MRLSYELDDKPARPGLGLIVLGVDETVEDDFRRLIPADRARLYHTRIESAPNLTAETIPLMAGRLTAAAALLPGAAGLNVIGYACTSGATLLGERTVTDLVNAAHPGVQVTDPLGALKAACRALGIRRLGLVSPYVAAVSDALVGALTDDGITVGCVATFDQEEERLVARISPASIRQALLRVGADPACDAVFASCTNLRAVEVLDDARHELGKPVLASNQVLAWHMARLAGIGTSTP